MLMVLSTSKHNSINVVVIIFWVFLCAYGFLYIVNDPDECQTKLNNDEYEVMLEKFK